MNATANGVGWVEHAKLKKQKVKAAFEQCLGIFDADDGRKAIVLRALECPCPFWNLGLHYLAGAHDFNEQKMAKYNKVCPNCPITLDCAKICPNAAKCAKIQCKQPCGHYGLVTELHVPSRRGMIPVRGKVYMQPLLRSSTLMWMQLKSTRGSLQHNC